MRGNRRKVSSQGVENASERFVFVNKATKGKEMEVRGGGELSGPERPSSILMSLVLFNSPGLITWQMAFLDQIIRNTLLPPKKGNFLD